MANQTKTAQITASITMLTTDRAELTTEVGTEYAIPLTQVRVHDAMATLLTDTATADDMGLVTGTPGTDAPTLQGVDFGGTSTDEKCAFLFTLPVEYVSGAAISCVIRGAILTTLSDGTATVDVECWPQDDSGGVAADICATAAQSINSLTTVERTFTITETNRVAGDVLVIRVSFAGSDTGNLGVMIPEIQKISLLLNVRG